MRSTSRVANNKNVLVGPFVPEGRKLLAHYDSVGKLAVTRYALHPMVVGAAGIAAAQAGTRAASPVRAHWTTRVRSRPDWGASPPDPTKVAASQEH